MLVVFTLVAAHRQRRPVPVPDDEKTPQQTVDPRRPRRAFETVRWTIVAVTLVCGAVLLGSPHLVRPEVRVPEPPEAPSLQFILRGLPEGTEIHVDRRWNWRSGAGINVGVRGPQQFLGFSSITIATTGDANDWRCAPLHGGRATWASGEWTSASMVASQEFDAIRSMPAATATELAELPGVQNVRRWDQVVTMAATDEPIDPMVEEMLTAGRAEEPAHIRPISLAGVFCAPQADSAASSGEPDIKSKQRFHHVAVPDVGVSAAGARISDSAEITLPPHWTHVSGNAYELDYSANGLRTADGGTSSGYRAWSLVFEDQLVVRAEDGERAMMLTLWGIWVGILAGAFIAFPGGRTRTRS